MSLLRVVFAVELVDILTECVLGRFRSYEIAYAKPAANDSIDGPALVRTR